jgi:4,5-dihydroxyphthalate decarboxylase
VSEKAISKEKSTVLSRRDFIRTTTLAVGAAGIAGSIGGCRSGIAKAGATPSHGLPITVAGYKLDRTEALIDGRVKVAGCDMQFKQSGIGDLNTHVFSGPQTLDVTEIGLHPFMLAYANEGFRDYTLLPVFPVRLFRHRSVFIRTDRGILKPQDLRGKKVATAGYSSTSLTWIRGIFQEEYGLRPEDMNWIISRKDSSAKDAGKVSKQESILPKGVPIRLGPKGIDESDLLVSGEVDAIFHAAEPKAFRERHQKVARLFPDYRATERSYYSKTGIFPIMHAVAIKKRFARENPWLIEAVFNAYSESKQMAYEFLTNDAWFRMLLPWIGKEFEQTRALMGSNYYSYGIKPNRKILEKLVEYSYQQGLCSRQLTIEELFDPTSLGLEENIV